MIRALIDEMGLFLIPFAVFAFVLVVTRRKLFHLDHWSRSSTWLAIAGLALVFASFLYAGLEPRPMSGFEPTHLEGGRVVPGRFH